MPRVPNTREVIPGAAVNIVLKADQPTGHTVSGFIGDVLTRGNHPRGIKVRLTDGRVGRVQSMAPEVDARRGTALAASEAADDPAVGPASLSFGSGPRPRDDHGDSGLPSQEIGLDAYVTYAKPRGNRKAKAAKGAASGTNATTAAVTAGLDDGVFDGSSRVVDQTSGSQVVTCPVCSAFEGDEAAVNHHVATHFDS